MGQGIVSVSTVLLEERQEGQPQTLDEWHTFLLLPDEYYVIEAKLDVNYPFWSVVVESDAIPLPVVEPYMTTEYDAEANVTRYYLDRVEAYNPHRVIWQRKEA